MNELKPVAWRQKANHANLITELHRRSCVLREDDFEPLILAIPDTHRVVSVELLETIIELLAGYEDTPKKIRAIIDNKEQKE